MVFGRFGGEWREGEEEGEREVKGFGSGDEWIEGVDKRFKERLLRMGSTVVLWWFLRSGLKDGGGGKVDLPTIT